MFLMVHLRGKSEARRIFMKQKAEKVEEKKKLGRIEFCISHVLFTETEWGRNRFLPKKRARAELNSITNKIGKTTTRKQKLQRATKMLK